MLDIHPLNVWSRSDEEIGRLMSNFAYTPFLLDGVTYASLEGFYVSLLCQDESKRRRAAKLWGLRAKHEIPKVKPSILCYGGEQFAPGSAAHHALIKRAMRAKLEAHPDLAQAFVATYPRPIVHDTGYPERPDTEFPHLVFCHLLTELRDEFRG